MQLMYLVGWLGRDPLEDLTTRTESAFRKKIIKVLHGRFAHMGKTLTDLHILGCELHQMCLAAVLRPDPLGEL